MSQSKGTARSIALDRPLAPGVRELSGEDPTFSDLCGVLTGMKPVTYTDCAPQRVPYLRELCRRLGLAILFPEEDLGVKGHHCKAAKKMVLIGERPELLRKAARAWLRSTVDGDWALLLGYPECCVKAYAAWYASAAGKDPRPDLVPFILRRTKDRARLDFRLNNLWNYFSRMNFDDAKDRTAYHKLMGLNRELDLAAAHVISWHPCSYDCPRSGKKAAEIHRFMLHHAPAYAGRLKALLARPAVYWGKFRYVLFRGEVERPGTLNYDAAEPPVTLLNEKLRRLLPLGDSLRFTARGAGLYRRGKLLFSMKDPVPELLAFE